jgi:ABC-type proline/glycine betaine transport system permease subunit
VGVELPLALPMILAGERIAAMVAFSNAGGLSSISPRRI